MTNKTITIGLTARERERELILLEEIALLDNDNDRLEYLQARADLFRLVSQGHGLQLSTEGY